VFETASFRRNLEEVAGDVRSNTGVAVEQTVFDILQFLAQANERPLMRLEESKPQLQRRGLTAALQSARELLSEAAGVARARQSQRISIADLAVAYQARLCQVWPFCR
jgi:hypothetical protein